MSIFKTCFLALIILGVTCQNVAAQTARVSGLVGITIVSSGNLLQIHTDDTRIQAGEVPAVEARMEETDTRLVYTDEINQDGQKDGVLVTLMY